MSFPTAVNSQITDSVAQANTQVLGVSPSSSLGNLMIATSQALSNAAHNATSGQLNSNVTAQAAMTQGIATLYSVDTSADGVATAKIFR